MDRKEAEETVLDAARNMAQFISENLEKKKREWHKAILKEEIVATLESEKKRLSSRKMKLYSDYRSEVLDKEGNMEELEKQVQKIKSQAGNYKTAINDYIEEQKKELFEYVNSRVNNFSKLQLVLVQHEPFEKTPTHKIKRFLYNNINIK